MGAEAMLIIAGGRLLFDIGKYIYTEVRRAEDHPTLETNAEKHDYVKEGATDYIKNHTFRAPYKEGERELTIKEEREVKEGVIKQIDDVIIKQVNAQK
jgi:hypothetical protein